MLKTEAGLEEGLESRALAAERVDHVSAGLDERSFEHVREKREHAVQRLELLVLTNAAVVDTGEKLSEDCEVKNQRRSQQGILALVEDVERVATAHHDLGIVLVDGALAIADSRDVLDDNEMVGMLTLLLAMSLVGRLEQEVVGFDHVIDDATLGDFLAPELSLARQVTAVVVAEMVVRRDREWLDTGVHEELGEHTLNLGLSTLQIVTANEGAVFLGESDAARNKGVLRSTVDERSTL